MNAKYESNQSKSEIDNMQKYSHFAQYSYVGTMHFNTISVNFMPISNSCLFHNMIDKPRMHDSTPRVEQLNNRLGNRLVIPPTNHSLHIY